MKNLRMASLVKLGLAVNLSLDEEDANPFLLQPKNTSEQYTSLMKELREAGAFKTTEEVSNREIEKFSEAVVDALTYQKDKSVKIIENGKVISRYFAIGYASRPLQYSGYRVSGDQNTYLTLKEAITAAGLKV